MMENFFLLYCLFSTFFFNRKITAIVDLLCESLTKNYYSSFYYILKEEKKKMLKSRKLFWWWRLIDRHSFTGNALMDEKSSSRIMVARFFFFFSSSAAAATCEKPTIGGRDEGKALISEREKVRTLFIYKDSRLFFTSLPYFSNALSLKKKK